VHPGTCSHVSKSMMVRPLMNRSKNGSLVSRFCVIGSLDNLGVDLAFILEKLLFCRILNSSIFLFAFLRFLKLFFTVILIYLSTYRNCIMIFIILNHQTIHVNCAAFKSYFPLPILPQSSEFDLICILNAHLKI
jgi:hypothetical protein